MTGIRTVSKLNDTDTVEFLDKPELVEVVCTTSKSNIEYHIKRERGRNHHLVFSVTKGNVPLALQGTYTSTIKAKKAFTDYARSIQKTRAAKREENIKAREEQKARRKVDGSKPNTKTSTNLHQGADN